MREGIACSGIPTAAELRSCQGIPNEARMNKGPVAWIECIQCIPCNPCESACPVGAITIGEKITNTPKLNAELCIGCGSCIAKCPGLSITVINKAYTDTLASLSFPYEYLPLPKAGSTVEAVGRDGKTVCPATVISVSKAPENHGTAIVGISFDKSKAEMVKSIKRLTVEEQ